MKIKDKIVRFICHDFWQKLWQTLVLVVKGFNNMDLNIRASGLTYSLLFAIVPLLALVMAIAKCFGMSELIEQQLQKSWLGETNFVPTIMEIVNRYLETAQGGVFIGVGILVLVWAVYSFFQNVEQAFNRVWGLKNTRSLLRQVTTYIAILFVIPVLIIVTSGLSIFLSSTTESLNMTFYARYHHWIIRVVQFVVAWCVFSWMYWAVPNTTVKWSAAIIPGILMGTIFQLLQNLSVYVLMFLSRTSVVYGAFAVIPILMIWLQWTCLLILIGVQMSAAIQMVSHPYIPDTMTRFPDECDSGEWNITMMQ